jgi:hypothetical protein
MRGHVAGAAGIRVVAPGAADIVCALEDDEVLHPALLQPDRPPRAREAAPTMATRTCGVLRADSECATPS